MQSHKRESFGIWPYTQKTWALDRTVPSARFFPKSTVARVSSIGGAPERRSTWFVVGAGPVSSTGKYHESVKLAFQTLCESRIPMTIGRAFTNIFAPPCEP